MSKSCSYVPINISYIITKLVFPYFRKFHSAPFKYGMIFTGEDLVNNTFGTYFNLSYLFMKISFSCLSYRFSYPVLEIIPEYNYNNCYNNQLGS